MILKQTQAEAIAKALSELNNIGATLIGTIALDGGISFTAWSDKSMSIAEHKTEREYFNNQAEFTALYKLV